MTESCKGILGFLTVISEDAAQMCRGVLNYSVLLMTCLDKNGAGAVAVVQTTLAFNQAALWPISRAEYTRNTG